MNTKQPISLIVIIQSVVLLFSADVILITDASNSYPCAQLLTKSDGSSNMPLKIQSNVPFSRTDWEALPPKSSVTSVKVSGGCSLRICHIKANRVFRSQSCNDFHQDEVFTDDFKKHDWDYSKETVLGLDCSCEKKTPCQKGCENQSISYTDKYQCATLFKDDHCSDCRFNPIILDLKMGRYDRNFSVISSLHVRPDCTVKANEVKNHYGNDSSFEFNPLREPGELIQINNKSYGYNLFQCSCEGFDIGKELEAAALTSDSSAIQISILSVLSFVACLTVLIVAILVYRCQTEKKKIYTVINRLDKEYHIRPDDVVIDYNKILGKGRFGTVYEAILTTVDGLKKPVAAKEIKPSSIYTDSSNYLRTLAREIDVLSAIGSHPNVVTMIGATYQGHDVVLILELCEHRSLEKFLKNYKLQFLMTFQCDYNNNVSNRSTVLQEYVRCGMENGSHGTNGALTNNYVDCGYLTQTRLVDWVYQVASAMEHISNLKILHLDLQARNVLLDVHLNAKISDFGLSKELNESYQYLKPPMQDPLPLNAMAPEVIGNYTFGMKTDVWAFGILVWEVYSLGDIPYRDQILENEMELKNLLQSGYKLPQPHICPSEIYQHIMCACWNLEPQERPGFVELREFLEKRSTKGVVHHGSYHSDVCTYQCFLTSRAEAT